MDRLINILPQCLEVERQYEESGININDPGRLINKGWIECAEFFLRNFDLTEKTINE